jgi:protein-S-isoprenylcysteine O-methyltransferase Ste14
MSTPSTPTRPVLRIGKLQITGAVARLIQLALFAGIAALIWWQKPSLGMWLSGGIWVAFMVYWARQARTPTPTVKAETRGSSLKHRAFREIGLILMFIPVWGLNRSVLPAGPAHVWVGLGVQLVGGWFYMRGKKELGRQWSNAISIKTDHQLVTTGPYRFIRHPMYTAMIAMALGTALVNTRLSALFGVALIAWSYVVKIGIEEVWMAEQFGAAHEEWRRHSWKLLPPLY